MKKVILSLAGVLAATAFAPEASAVPSFARQTGMACNACHFQSYPILTSFGKAFKTSGFTVMGAQGKVEGDHGLSLPNTLNMSAYFQARYIKTGGTDVQLAAPAPEVRTTNSGRIDVPDEFALFAGGRVTENIGALTEINIGGPAAGLAAVKLPIMFDMSGTKVGVIPFTGGAGPQWGFDVFATGSAANARVIENGGGYSASMYIGTQLPASGAALVAANETFHVSFTPWVQGLAASNAGLTATKLSGRYIRAAWTPTMSGWDLGLGVQSFSGDSLAGIGAVSIPGTTRDSATVIDFQGQGEVAAMPIGVYGSYGWADGQLAGAVNTFNAGTERKSSFGLLADLGVIPSTLNLQLGFMRNKTGMNQIDALGVLVPGTNETDNSYTLGVRYKLTQNAKLALAHTKSTGTAYNVAAGGVTGTSPNALRGAGTGDSLTTFILSAGF